MAYLRRVYQTPLTISETVDGCWQVKVYKFTGEGEYVARLYINGKQYAPADYFTNDKEDAIATANHMVITAAQGK